MSSEWEGSIIMPSQTKGKQISISDRLRYAFDNTMAAGPVALIGWLGLLSVIVIAAVALIITLARISPGDADESITFLEAFWLSMMRTLDAGTMGGDTGWKFRVAMFVVTLGGVFVVSTLIGILSNGLEDKLEELRKGRSFVVEHNHTLILGWSPKIFTIITELVSANANQKNPRIVILADRDKVEMEDDIRAKIPSTKNTRVICRTGSPIDLDDLEIVNPHAARSIIILSPEGDAPDSQVIKSILALTNNPKRRAEPYHIVAEIRHAKNVDVARMVGRDEAQLVLAGDLISRITVQTCRQSGLSVVYTELLDFGGDEIYFKHEPALAGRTFGEALSAYEDSSVIGLQFAGGACKLNPPMDTPIGPNDRIIAISEDDDTIRLSAAGMATTDEAALNGAHPAPPQPERTLILGWNERACTIITELNNYVAPGSEVLVVADEAEADNEAACTAQHLQNVRVEMRVGDTTDRATLEGLNIPTYQHVIILCYSNSLDTQEADAHTLITLLHLRNIAQQSGHSFSIVSEMLDMRNRQLAEVTHADDFIVSDALTSLMLSQVSENKDLAQVFADLFDADGSEVYLKPAADYVVTGREVNFYTVLEAARRRGEVAIGYRQQTHANDADKSYGVAVNPAKSARVTFTAQDRVIVLAES
jgi:ion channel POLLUX/CASTOR